MPSQFFHTANALHYLLFRLFFQSAYAIFKLVRKNKKLKQDILALVMLPVSVALLAVYFRIDYFFTTLLYFGLPALYLSLQDKKKVKRNLIFSSLFTIPAIYADYVAEKSLAWYEPSSITGFRVGGIVPIEAILWFF